MIRVVDCDLTARCYPTRDDDDPLAAKPVELLELTVGMTGMVNEPGEVAYDRRIVSGNSMEPFFF